jgi:hypothetical protein
LPDNYSHNYRPKLIKVLQKRDLLLSEVFKTLPEITC